VRVAAGEKAPFAGILLTPAALAKTIAELEARASKLALELEAAKREAVANLAAGKKSAEAALNLERERRAALEADLLRRSALYEKSLDRLSSSEPWYKSGYLTMGLGLLLGGGICAGTAAAVR
jgi:hypothetical protein